MSSGGDKYLFFAKTKEAFVIKIIGELLNNTIKWAPMRLTENGIFLTQADNLNHQLIDLALYKENFPKFKLVKPLNFLVNSMHLYKMLKSIKKKDTITLFITESDPLNLGICVEQSDEDNKINTHIRISYNQPDIPEPLTGYEDHVIMNNKEFQKMKNLHSISKTINIKSKPGYIRFFCDGNDFYSREFIIGNPEDEDNKHLQIGFNQNFSTLHITGLAKCAGQSSNVQVFTNEELPLKIKMKVGTMGDLIVYIKSQEMIDLEKKSDEYPAGDDSDSAETCEE
jgi:DNA polymerase III sliding clamp (beta) subunit (PCNA family)